MKTLTTLAIALCALSAPALSFAQSTAQSSAPVTRAEVRAELIALEQAGYDPSAGESVDYPARLQAAQAKVSAAQAPRAAAPQGQHSAATPDADCTGPASFCNVYFGS